MRVLIGLIVAAVALWYLVDTTVSIVYENVDVPEQEAQLRYLAGFIFLAVGAILVWRK